MYKQGGYEAHVTCDLRFAPRVAEIGEETTWVFSQISGCPLLGKGTYCYLTGYDKDSLVLKQELDNICNKLISSSIPVLRSKIEHIVYDSKTGVNELASPEAGL